MVPVSCQGNKTVANPTTRSTASTLEARFSITAHYMREPSQYARAIADLNKERMDQLK